MKKAYPFLIQAAWCIILTAGLLTACNGHENTPEAPSPEKAPLKLTFKLPSLLNAESRDATPPTLSGIPFNDVWVLQYNEAQTALLGAKYYTTSDIQSDAASSDYLVIVPTGDGGTSYFTNANSHFYTIVNGGKELFGPLTDMEFADLTNTLQSSYGNATALQKILKATPDASKTVSDEPGLLIDGPIAYSSTGTTTDIAIRANLSRTYACINLSYKETNLADGKFTPTEGVVVNLPTHLALFTREGATGGNYPSVKDAVANENTVTANGNENNGGEKTLYTSATTPSTPWDADTPLTFYMGENLRGTGTSTTYQGKNLASNGPSGTLDGCTHLIIRGTYQYCTGTDAGGNPVYSTDGISVEYKLYLGGNLTNDYNIRRNMRYTVTMNISGANSVDARVTITDSNVIVFDDSQTIENEVTL